jgi:mRNA-degrading endonuclease RelE of RelBE toxin-antitoxin system
MRYTITIKPKALKDLERLEEHDQRRVIRALERMSGDLAGDVKRLTNFTLPRSID